MISSETRATLSSNPKNKISHDPLRRFPALSMRQLPVITSSFDWFTVLSVSLVIGYNNYFGFGFKTLN